MSENKNKIEMKFLEIGRVEWNSSNEMESEKGTHKKKKNTEKETISIQ